jgi:hypothetical protein
MYVLWGAALALLITTALVCWLLVAPVMRVRAVIDEYEKQRSGLSAEVGTYYAIDFQVDDDSLPIPTMVSIEGAKAVVAKSGGPDRLRRELGVYLRMPRWCAFRRARACELLGFCGEEAGPFLRELREDDDAEVRCAAAWALKAIGGRADCVTVSSPP